MQVLLFSSSRVIIYTRVISINKRLCPSSSSITLFQLGIILNSCHYYIFLICFTIVEPNSRDNTKRREIYVVGHNSRHVYFFVKMRSASPCLLPISSPFLCECLSLVWCLVITTVYLLLGKCSPTLGRQPGRLTARTARPLLTTAIISEHRFNLGHNCNQRPWHCSLNTLSFRET